MFSLLASAQQPFPSFGLGPVEKHHSLQRHALTRLSTYLSPSVKALSPHEPKGYVVKSPPC